MDEPRKCWTRAEIKRLIDFYRSKPELWDINHKEYINKNCRQVLYSQIGHELKTSSVEVIRKLRILRNQYNNERRTREESKWSYFEDFSFLEDIDRPGKEVTKTTNELDNSSCIENVSIVRSHDNEKESKKEETQSKPGIKIQKDEYEALLQIAAQTLSHGEDQYTIFGTYVASEIRNTKSEHLRSKMKRKIQQVISQINEEDEYLIKSSRSEKNDTPERSICDFSDLDKDIHNEITLLLNDPNND